MVPCLQRVTFYGRSKLGNSKSICDIVETQKRRFQ